MYMENKKCFEIDWFAVSDCCAGEPREARGESVVEIERHKAKEHGFETNVDCGTCNMIAKKTANIIPILSINVAHIYLIDVGMCGYLFPYVM
jgi:hypothetical protein